jgi:alkanesulfonate monooxygenase SsuD/methylene tetrahydromethanopterin reductase-like flavin-dependent oxidoreductase (luciferase family)
MSVLSDTVRVCLMIEGQEDVTWAQWQALAATAEAAGFEALFRSDHYMPLEGGPGGSLDAWGTLNALAALTSTLRLGTLVSPATFRHPSTLAREVVTADHVSGGGRVELGLGAGWHEGEHRAFGFPFDATKDRFDRLAEQMEIVHRSWTEGPFDFEGRFYRLESSDPQPKPLSKPNLIAGGSAKPRGAALAARWADEYNTVYATVEECKERRERIAAACADQGRDPIPFSLMTSFAVNGDPADHHPAWIVGSLDEMAAQLKALEQAGVHRVMLQHLQHHDLETVELLGRELIPVVR